MLKLFNEDLFPLLIKLFLIINHLIIQLILNGNLLLKSKQRTNYIFRSLKIKLVQIIPENTLLINLEPFKKKFKIKDKEICLMLLNINNKRKMNYLYHYPHLKKKIKVQKDKKKEKLKINFQMIKIRIYNHLKILKWFLLNFSIKDFLFNCKIVNFNISLLTKINIMLVIILQKDSLKDLMKIE